MSELRERDLIPALEEQGWVVNTTSNGHYKAYPPDDEKSLVTFSLGSNDPRAIKNTLSDLRSRGFRWPPGTLKKLPQTSEKDLDELYQALKQRLLEVQHSQMKFDETAMKLRDAEKMHGASKNMLDSAVRKMQEAHALFNMAFEEES